MIEKQEKENIFRYSLDPINHKDKPEVGTQLKVFPS